MSVTASFRPPLGIIGFGAFGRLMAGHLRPHFQLRAYDPALLPCSPVGTEEVTPGSLAEAAGCPFVVLAMPVSRLADTIPALGPHLRPGTLVLDVGSVKVVPAAIMLRGLPGHVGIVTTHPLFGPQSARDGIKGLKVAVCPGPGRRQPPRRRLPAPCARPAGDGDDAGRP